MAPEISASVGAGLSRFWGGDGPLELSSLTALRKGTDFQFVQLFFDWQDRRDAFPAPYLSERRLRGAGQGPDFPSVFSRLYNGIHTRGRAV